MDQVESVIRSATAKSRDGRIDVTDFLNEAAGSMRYGVFTPMEANIIWHFATRGGSSASARLAPIDFDALLDPKASKVRCSGPSGTDGPYDLQWQAPQRSTSVVEASSASSSFFNDFLHSAYNFGLGGIGGAIGATAVYPIDLVKTR